MAAWEIDPRFDTRENADVLRFLRQSGPSAHSDIADELIRSASGLSGVSHYCPNPAAYAFVVLHLANSLIIGLAHGQAKLAYRLRGDPFAQAIAEGGSPAAELGPDWVHFQPWSDDERLEESRRRLARWCALAAHQESA